MIASVRGIVKDVRTYSGISKTGNSYNSTVITIGTYEFSFFNLKEGTLHEDMEIEVAFMRKGRYNNAINHTLHILREKTRTIGFVPAEFKSIPQQLFRNEY